MAKSSSNRRLFQADGYTFMRWIEPEDVESMLAAGEIKPCYDPRTDRAIGFQLVGRSLERSPEHASSTSALIPFSRVTNPLMYPSHLHYQIPAKGDHRLRWLNRFMDKFGEDREPIAAAFCNADPSSYELDRSGLANSIS
jgi:hypothetical protein